MSSEIVQCIHLVTEMNLQVKPKLQTFPFPKPPDPSSITVLEATLTVTLTKCDVCCQALLISLFIDSLFPLVTNPLLTDLVLF